MAGKPWQLGGEHYRVQETVSLWASRPYRSEEPGNNRMQRTKPALARMDAGFAADPGVSPINAGITTWLQHECDTLGGIRAGAPV